jgi:hypothetical protein
MGYPMTYRRVVNRNGLTGDYEHEPPVPLNTVRKSLVAGDLRRLEKDCRDRWHLDAYAAVTGVPVESVKAVLDAFFDRDAEIENARVKTSHEQREREVR